MPHIAKDDDHIIIYCGCGDCSHHAHFGVDFECDLEPCHPNSTEFVITVCEHNKDSLLRKLKRCTKILLGKETTFAEVIVFQEEVTELRNWINRQLRRNKNYEKESKPKMPRVWKDGSEAGNA